MQKTHGFALAAVAAALAMALPGAAPAGEIIPRQLLFGNPDKAQARVSPDGRWLSWLAPKDGVLNVWLAPLAHPEQAKPISDEKGRPIRQHFWSQDSRMILWINDKNGDENFLLYGVDVNSGAVKLLTPFEKTRAEFVAASVQKPSRVLVALNNRDPQYHDIYELDLQTGKLTLKLENHEWAGVIADDSLTPRLAIKQPDTGVTEIYKIDGPKPKLYRTIPYEDSLTTNVFGYSTDGKVLYSVDSVGRDTAALVATDVATDKATIIGQSPKADIGDALFAPRTGRVQAYSVNYLQSEWIAVDNSIKGDLEFLAKELKGDVQVGSRTNDDRYWTVSVDKPEAPVAAYLYDKRERKLKKLFDTRPALAGKVLAPMYGVEIKSRDGLTLPSYLTLPVGADTNGDGRPEKALPLVLNVHGGPWGRDTYGFRPEQQWFANRGYAVLQVNFRASTGFGKAFTNAGDKEWAGKMHNDLLDAVKWAVDNKITTADKVAIYGGSYGGYATLVGLSFTPTTFACGVDIVGPSNLETLLSTIPPYWKPLFETFARRVGDPRTEDGRKLLKERSPLTRAGDIKRPLVIAQGANDPRVKRAESDQIVAAMKAKKIPVTYALYPDEGHGFARPQNRVSFYAISEAFLSKCLGGQFQPVGDDFKGSSLQVLEGASYVPGLSDALKK